MSAHVYRVQIFGTSSTGIAYTLGTSYLADVPERFGGQRVDLLSARVESLDWSINLTDKDGYVSSILSSTGGVPHLLTRRIRMQRSIDGGAYATVGAGRILQIAQQDVAGYTVRIADERLIERHTNIWTSPRGSTAGAWADGTILYPFYQYYVRGGNIHGEWGAGWTPLPPWWTLEYDQSISGYKRLITVTGVPGLDPKAEGYMRDDARPGMSVWRSVTEIADDAPFYGIYKHIRFHTTAATSGLEIIGFSQAGGGNFLADVEQAVDRFNEDANNQDNRIREIWLRDPASKLPLTGAIRGQLRARYAPPTRVAPYHLGDFDPNRIAGSSGFGPPGGVDPFTWVKWVYDGSYQSTGTWDGERNRVRTVRYSTAAFSDYSASNPRGLLNHPDFPAMRFRPTKPEKMATAVGSAYQTLGVLPVCDPDGRVSPVRVKLPNKQQIPTVAALYSFASSNCQQVPSWSHSANDIVSQINFNFVSYTPRYSPDAESMDGLDTRAHTITRDTAPTTGAVLEQIREIEIDVDGYHTPHIFEERVADARAKDIRSMYGPGAQMMAVKTLAAASTVAVGEWVRLTNLPIPNVRLGTRGGNQVALVLTKTHLRDGVHYEMVYGGPAVQPLTAPTISAVKSPSQPYHQVNVTIGNLDPRDGYTLEHARSTGTPADTAWQRLTVGDTAETVYVGELAMGTKHWFRTYATPTDQSGSAIGSSYVNSTAVVLDAVAAPSNLTATSSEITAYTVPLSWSLGYQFYPTQIMLNAAATSAIVSQVDAGDTRYTLTGLTPETTYGAYVWTAGPYGGHSAASTKAAFTTLATSDPGGRYTLKKPKSIKIVLGTTPSPSSST